MTIDFHTHTFPPALAERVLSKLQLVARSKAYTDGTQTGLLTAMEQAGVDLSVVLPVATDVHQVEKLNVLSAQQNERGDRRLLFFGAMHPDFSDYKAELKRIAGYGLKGIKLHPLYQGVAFDDVRYLRILDEASALGLIIVTHAGWDIGVGGDLSSPDRMLRAFLTVQPDKLVLAHIGGWRQWDEVREKLAGLPLYLDTALSLGVLTPAPGTVRAPDDRWLISREQFMGILQKHGADRLLFATDSPWGDQAAALSVLDSMPLTPAQNAAIRGDNAAKLLGL